MDGYWMGIMSLKNRMALMDRHYMSFITIFFIEKNANPNHNEILLLRHFRAIYSLKNVVND